MRVLFAALVFSFVPLELQAVAAETPPPPFGESSAAATAWQTLTDGAVPLPAAGVPGPLCVFGSHAFPVILGGRRGGGGEPLVAAALSREGAGRILAFGHGGYLAPDRDAFRPLLRNGLRWLAPARGSRDGAASTVRVAARRPARWRALAEELGFEVGAFDPSTSSPPDVLILDAHHLRNEADVARVRRWIEQGTGLLTAGLGWGWLQLHPGKSLREDFLGNQLLRPFGIAWADGTLRAPAGGFPIGRPPAVAHARLALRALTKEGGRDLSASDRAVAAAVLTSAVRTLPAAEPSVVVPLREAARGEDVVPTAKDPLGLERALARVLLPLQLEMMDEAFRAGGVGRAHPAAADFPGEVGEEDREGKSAPRVTRRVSVDGAIPGWHSTGLYAAAGEVIEVALPAGSGDADPASAGLHVRIGCHKDLLWHKPRWRRVPDITRTFALRSRSTRAMCPFGGLIYIVVPERCAAGPFTVEISGAVEAPYFRAGVTEPDAWRQEIRRRAAPWAELASDRIVVSVPSSSVRELADPAGVLAVWDRILELDEELCGHSAAARRPLRIVCDRQISAGYMHAGYPILCGWDQRVNLVDRDHLLAGSWGFFHEIGHNHQRPAWTFRGTGEVTCNLFSLYVYEKLCGIDLRDARSRMSPARRAKIIEGWDFDRPDFARWQREPFLALVLYAEIAETFGWEPYRRAFRSYRDLPAARRPKSDEDKRDRFLELLSRAAGRNLAPQFDRWGVPIRDSAREAVADLPAWEYRPGAP